MARQPVTYKYVIARLEEDLIRDQPPDVIQFCADYFARLLATQRASCPTCLTRGQLPQLSTATVFTSTPFFPETLYQHPQRFARRPALASVQFVRGPEETRLQRSDRPDAERQQLQHKIASYHSMSAPFASGVNPFAGGASSSGMQRVVEEDEDGAAASSATPAFGHSGASLFSTPFNTDSNPDTLGSEFRHTHNPESYPAQYNFARRTSVSAESLKPSADTDDNWSPPNHQKTPEQLERLQNALKENFLFAHLDEEQYSQVLGALVEKPIPAKDIRVIVQGDVGDYFYIVEKGIFEVYVHPSGSVQPGPSGLGDHVGTIKAGGSFGELALMYNAPRAATIVSASPASTLWALDRVTFRKILLESSFARRRMYEHFLAEVPLLSSLTPYERSKIADALESSKFSAGETIIREGDQGSTFYLMVSGQADAYKSNEEGVVKHYEKGDFFGELALLNDQPRAATVVATTDVKVAVLGKSAFQRMLGPVESIMRRTKYVGVKSGVEEMDPLQKD